MISMALQGLVFPTVPTFSSTHFTQSCITGIIWTMSLHRLSLAWITELRGPSYSMYKSGHKGQTKPWLEYDKVNVTTWRVVTAMARFLLI